MKKSFFVYFAAVVVLLLLAERAFAQSVATQVVVTVVPNAPSDLTAVPTSPTQVELTWTNNALDADGVSVERKTGVAGTYVQIATTSPDLATYIDNSAAPATTYFYRVRAYLGSTYSAYSDEASVTTPSSSSGGGGGGGSGGGGGGGGGGSSGGGGGYIPPPTTTPTNVTFSGSAYPL